MGKLSVFLVITPLLLAGAFIFFRPTPETTGPGHQEILMDTLNYLDYSEVNLEAALSKGRAVLFFAATRWCHTCSALDKEILQRVSEVPADVTILKVDYDNDHAMNTKWGVTTQHTLVILDENGQEVTRWVGGGFDDLLNRLGQS